MQFNRQADGTMELRRKPSVDTGMGRAYCCRSAARQLNYDIDLFPHSD